MSSATNFLSHWLITGIVNFLMKGCNARIKHKRDKLNVITLWIICLLETREQDEICGNVVRPKLVNVAKGFKETRKERE